jgi:hypothetical protein
MDKSTAVQRAANTTHFAAQVINDYGEQSPEATAALDAVARDVTSARQHGATDDEILRTLPA